MKASWKNRIPGGAEGEGVRQRLLDAALDLFSQKGYTAATVQEIVDRAGVTKPTLYYYFQNKEGIFLELMHQARRSFDTLLAEARQEAGSIQGRILRLAQKIYDLFLDRLELARLILSVHYRQEPGTPIFDLEAYAEKVRDHLQELLREGVRRGEFQRHRIEDMTWALLGAINVAVELRLWHPEKAADSRRLVRILKVIFEGIDQKQA